MAAASFSKEYRIMARCQASMSDVAMSNSPLSMIFCAVYSTATSNMFFNEPTALSDA